MGSSRDLGLLSNRLFSPCSSNVFIHKIVFVCVCGGGIEGKGFTEKGVQTRPGTSSAVGVMGEKEGASRAAIGAARRRGFRQVSPELPNRRERGYRKFFLERRGGHESCDSGLTGGFREATELWGTPGQVAPGWSARGSAEVAPSPARGPLLSGRAEVGRRGWPPGRISKTQNYGSPGLARVDPGMLGLGREKSPGCWESHRSFSSRRIG